MRYESENFVLDTDDYSLTRNGVNHPIEPRVFDLLVGVRRVPVRKGNVLAIG